MKTFDKWLGSITVAILVILIAWAFAFQFLNLVMGNAPVGGVAGGYADVLIYDSYSR